MSLSTILTAELDAKGWSINRLARECELRPSSVGDVVSGHTRNPGILTVSTILHALGRDFGWLHRKTKGAAAVEGNSG